MALKQATMFKDFRISTSSQNESVKFQKVEPKTISVKNDNFATQVEIYDASDDTDFFAYKYITFDDSAIFEITDCMKNEKYTTLFIQYLSNITFDEFDENFRVDSVSVRHMQDLGLDINQLFTIFGNQVTPSKHYYSHSETAGAPFMYAIRLRFASIPENLTYGFTHRKNEVKSLGTWGGYSGGASYSNPADPSTRNVAIKVNEDTLTDPIYSAILPIPYKDKKTYVGFTDYLWVNFDAYKFEITTAKFINTLKSLLSDLVISAELIILSNNQLCLVYPKNEVLEKEYLRVGYSNNEYNISLELFDATGEGAYGSVDVVCASEHAINGSCLYGMPVFLNAKKLNVETRIIERLAFYKLPLSELDSNNKICFSLNFLGNRIDISKLRKDGSIYVKNNLGSMRVYVDFQRNIYQDIQNEIEYSKSAFSNYNAYKKSNIDLLNSQKDASLRQLQKQQRGLQTLDTATGVGDTFARSAFAFGTGGVGSGAGVLLGGVANAVTSEIKFNATQQNALANERLAQRQAHQSASSIIVPENFVSGEMSFINSFTMWIHSISQSIIPCLYTIEYVTPNVYLLSKNVFNNQMTEKIGNMQLLPTATRVFSWYPATFPRKIYQAFITTRNPANNRKDFTIYCTD